MLREAQVFFPKGALPLEGILMLERGNLGVGRPLARIAKECI